VPDVVPNRSERLLTSISHEDERSRIASEKIPEANDSAAGSVIKPDPQVARWKEMAIERSDPRFKAADLSEEEFIGIMTEHPDSEPVGLLEPFMETNQWKAHSEHALIEPLEGYSLRYSPGAGDELDVYLLFHDELVGIYCGEMLFIEPGHRKQELGRELILAGFAQTPWKNKVRKVTPAGKRSFEKAYRFVTETVRRLDAN
jgi:hypothetical protein